MYSLLLLKVREASLRREAEKWARTLRSKIGSSSCDHDQTDLPRTLSYAVDQFLAVDIPSFFQALLLLSGGLLSDLLINVVEDGTQ